MRMRDGWKRFGRGVPLSLSLSPYLSSLHLTQCEVVRAL